MSPSSGAAQTVGARAIEMGVPSSVRALAMTAASVFSSRARARVRACARGTDLTDAFEVEFD
jgi:hypothetical protein